MAAWKRYIGVLALGLVLIAICCIGLAQETDSIDFGGVPVGQTGTASYTFKILETSETSATVTIYPPSPPFGLQDAPSGSFTLAPGQAITFGVTFTPTVAGDYTGSFTITAQGGYPVQEKTTTVYLTGHSGSGGEAPPPGETPTTPGITIPFPLFPPTTQAPGGAVPGTTDEEGKFKLALSPTTTVAGRLTKCEDGSPLPNLPFQMAKTDAGFSLFVSGYEEKDVTEFSRFSIMGLESYDLGDICLVPQEETVPTGGKIPTAGAEEKKPDYAFVGGAPCLLLAPADSEDAYCPHDERLYPQGEGFIGIPPTKLPLTATVLVEAKVVNGGQKPAPKPVVHLILEDRPVSLPVVVDSTFVVPPAGVPQYWEIEASVPISLSGDHLPSFQMVIDPGNAVEELSEANNSWEGKAVAAYKLVDDPKIVKPVSPEEEQALLRIKADGTWVVGVKKPLTIIAQAQVEEPSKCAVVTPGGGSASCSAYAPLDLRYRFNFGDGTTARGKKVTHTYTKTGKYTVTVTTTLGDKQRQTTQAVEVTNKPVVTALSQRYIRVFVGGVPVDNTFTATVDPNGNTLESVLFILNGESKPGQVTGNAATYIQDMGSLHLWPQTNTLQAIAIARDPNGQRVSSDPYPSPPLTIPVAPVPSWLAWMSPLAPTPRGNTIDYSASFAFPNIPIDVSYNIPDWVPIIGGKYSFTAGSQTGLSLNSLGPGSLSGEGHAGFEKSSGDWTFGFSGGAEGKGTLNIGPPIVLTAGTFSLGLNGSVAKSFDLCDTFTPLRAACRIPIIGRGVRWLCRRAELGVGLSLGVAGDISFASADPGACLPGIDCSGSARLSGGLQASLTLSVSIASLTVFGGGTLTANFVAPGSELGFLDFHSLIASGEVGVNIEVDLWLFSASKEFSFPFDCRILSPPRGFATTVETDWTFPERPYAGLSYSTFRGKEEKLDKLNTTQFLLVENVFPHAQPKLARDLGLTLAAWTTDDISKPYPLGREITCSLGAMPTALGLPQEVTDNLLPDSQVDLAMGPAGAPIAVWVQHVSPPAPPKSVQDLSLALFSGLEISWSRYDRRTKAWSAPTRLTKNDLPDHSPNLLSGPQGITGVIWTANTHGEIFPDASAPDTLYISRWDGRLFTTPQLLRENDTAFMRAFVDLGNKFLYVWVQDMDGDLATPNDEELFSAIWNGTSWEDQQRLTQNDSDDESPLLFADGWGRAILLWVRVRDGEGGGKVGKLHARHFDPAGWGSEKAVLDDQSMFDFCAAQARDGRIAVVWEGFGDQGPDLFTSIYDPIDDTSSEPRQLTADPSMEGQVDVVFDGYSLGLVFVRTEVADETSIIHYTGPDAEDPTISYHDKEVQITAPMPGEIDLYLLEADMSTSP